MTTDSTTMLGNKGEALAVAYLKEKGYTILARNYRYRKAEIDVIASGEGFLVILEVKTRTGGFYESLSESITAIKIRRLIAAADHFALENDFKIEIRFDIIQVILKATGHQIHHIKDAFYFF
ncbi:YraN family protein [Robiginitalea sp. IMCC43444]|uniref:YraN family protein n=1 Tax=Robiginitalea sp. IMCC43444 TaxID=3459121 RepID=UPI0040430D14